MSWKTIGKTVTEKLLILVHSGRGRAEDYCWAKERTEGVRGRTHIQVRGKVLSRGKGRGHILGHQ